MEQIKSKSGRKHRNDKEVFEALEEFGDLSITEFCELFEISESTYHNWQQKYRVMKETMDEGVFMRYKDEALLTAGEPLRLEVSMPDGRTIRMYGAVEIELIKLLTQVS
ncbi:hypothetical protein [Pedobacter sp. JY14-1]|uniref:hypothetical protein n=1 Tax=Pedobacter sp. JY14-1 TaxID=3034151 RepID=UPI0023E19760|nr:hypothetical protein [Pedobacter sp. JY14-1]